MDKSKLVEQRYKTAQKIYADLGVDTEKAITKLQQIPISLHSWQGDDVCGFENNDGLIGGGCLVTGSYPGRARNGEELRADMTKALSLIPGRNRVNLQAIHAEMSDKKVDRNRYEPKHFAAWVDWARCNGFGLDFNGSFFSHPMANNGMTLASSDQSIREFWVEHAIASRKIGEYMGRELGTPCITNIWIPDGYKDTPIDRNAPRERLKKSLDQIFAEKIDKKFSRDALESKLFGIGLESYTVGSHEFYLGYAARNNLYICLDSGHFHPTEVISDKISSVLSSVDGLMLHVSRGVRWDSDHVVVLSDELNAIAQEIIRGNFLDRVNIGLDFFDASISRVTAWVIGARSMFKALLIALLEPIVKLRTIEYNYDYTARLVALEEIKALPFGMVWDYYCFRNGVPTGSDWFKEIRQYEADVTSRRI